jgi:small subunit ribosomal protein S16
MGRRHRPFFRINVVDGRTPRNGKILETIGHYDPIEKDKSKQVVLNTEKAKSWLEKGAIPTASAAELLQRAGVKNKFVKEMVSRRSKARILVRKKGLPFTKAEKEVLKKKAEAEKEALKKKAEAEKKQADAEKKQAEAKPEQKA